MDSMFTAQLLEMGIDDSVASAAVKATGASSLQAALDWALANPSGVAAPTEASAPAASSSTSSPPAADPASWTAAGDDQAEGPTAEEIEEAKRIAAAQGFKVKGVAKGPSDGAVQVKAPLTAEEKAAKVAELKARMAENRAKQFEAAKVKDKGDEISRRAEGKKAMMSREELQQQQRLKEAQAARREKHEAALQRKKVLAQIEADKQARREAKEGASAAKVSSVANPEAAPVTTPSSVPTTLSEESQFTIRVTLRGKGTKMFNFLGGNTVQDVIDKAEMDFDHVPLRLFDQASHRTINSDDIRSQTLIQAGFSTRTALIAEATRANPGAGLGQGAAGMGVYGTHI